jgi:hypothetical protein
LTLLALLAAGPGAAPDVRLERLGRLDHEPIREASGVVKSRRHDGVFWTHNDSGNPSALFAVRRDGSLIRSFAVAAPNIDWEDIAADDRGHLYLGDVGNNDGRLPLRAVYQVDEPDPSRDEPKPLKVKSAWHYRFPPSGRFDAEGLAIDGDRALIVAKTFDGRPAEVYALPLGPPAPLLRPATPERVGTLPGFTEPVTGADLSADGRRLVVCSTAAVGVFLRSGRDGWTPLALRSFRSGDDVEAVCWDGDDILLAGEGRGVFRVKADTWRGSRRPVPSVTPIRRATP